MAHELTRVGDVVELQRRQVTVDVTTTYEEIGVRSFGKGIFHKDPVSGADLGNKRVYEIHPGDLVISNVFAWEGAIAVAAADEDGKIGSHRFMTFKADPHRASASYLRYYLLSDAGLSLIRSASPGSAGRNRTLGIKAFQDIEIALPPLERQQAIAARLEAVESRVVSVSDQLRTAKDLSSKALSALVHRADLDDSDKRRRDWKRLSVGEFLALDIDEVRLQDDETYPMTGVYSFGRGLFEKEPVSGNDTSYTRYYRLHEGQIVLSRLFGWEGAIAPVANEFGGRFVSTEFPTFSVNDDLALPAFTAALFGTETFWSRLRSEAEGMGVRRQRIYAEQFLDQQVWLPPVSYQREMGPKLRSLHEAANEERRRELLEAALPSLLNATFNEVA